MVVVAPPLRVTVAPVIGALVAEEVTVPLIWVTGTWEKLDQMTLEPVVLVPAWPALVSAVWVPSIIQPGWVVPAGHTLPSTTSPATSSWAS